MRNRLAASLLSVLLGATVLSAAPSAQAVTPARQDTLLSGQSLVAGSTHNRLLSANLAFSLDAESFLLSLNEYETNAAGILGSTLATWYAYAKPTTTDASVLSMRADGNLTFTTSKNRLIWQSNTAGMGQNDRLVLEPLGNLVIISSANKIVWSLGTGRALLGSGKALASSASLIYQEVPTCPTRLQMQADGNLVISVHGRVVWQTHTHSPGAHLGLRATGDLDIFAAGTGRIVWASHTLSHTKDSWLQMGRGDIHLDTNNKPSALGGYWHSLFLGSPGC